MLKRLHLKNFTVFADADFEFGPGLNVLVGTNGTGKSHVLKVGYVVETLRAEIKNIDLSSEFSRLSKRESEWTGRLFYELPDVFRTDLKNLVSFGAANKSADVEVDFQTDYSKDESVHFEISSELESLRITGGREIASEEIKVLAPVFIPAKEILTLSWMLPGSEQIVAPIEKNYLNLLKQLRLLPLRKPEAALAISILTEVLGGEVREEGDKYFLVDKTGQRTAISMVAEGLRKFGILQKLLTNGSLTKTTTLYWDEPESNLNPALLRKLAVVLVELSRQGFQIILATHSMSLLKQFHILSRQPAETPLPIYYFGLNTQPGQPTTVIRRDNFEYLPDVVALEVELEQADDLEEIFAREDRQANADHSGGR
jgi:predicted ATP-binding protein involved in virulence